MAFQYPQSSPEQVSILHEHFGNEIELLTDDGTALSYVIKQEFRWGDGTYVVLQPFASKDEDELEFMRVIVDQAEIELENIVDDEEWEAVSEAYDDLQFVNDERP